MPKVTGPLFSLSASGTFQGLMEFKTKGGVTTVGKVRTKPATRSAAQQQQAARFAAAVAGWKALSPIEQQEWKTAATGTGVNGYQLYLSEYQGQNITAPDQPLVP